MRTPTLALLLAALAAPAAASNVQTPRALPAAAASCAMGYADFEHLVGHLDMPDCPAGLGAEGAFCRLAVSAERAIVFVFDPATDCLVASQTWEEDRFRVTLD